MTDLILNQLTSSQLESAKLNLSHAYLFAGPRGLGKTIAAQKFAREVLCTNPTPGDIERWIIQVGPIDNKSISSSQTAEIRKYINSKKPEHIDYKIIIIDKADNMSLEATNSLLLSLEEPSVDTIIIMVSDRPEAILPTIISRVQKINFVPPSMQQLQELRDELGVDDYILSQVGPYPGLLRQVSGQNLEHHKELDKLSTQFLEGNLRTRLTAISNISEKALAEELIKLLSSKIKLSAPLDALWLRRANSLILAHIHLYNNGNPKFVLEKLALEFE